MIRAERTIRPLTAAAGRKLRFFRFAMNHTGDTEPKKREAAQFLRERGYDRERGLRVRARLSRGAGEGRPRHHGAHARGVLAIHRD
jgi:hypothetical protein